MGRNIKHLGLAFTLSATLAASFASAQNSEARLKVNLKDADLQTATRMIAERTGVQFYFKSTKAFNRVTLQVENQIADDVIRFICDAAGAYVTKNDAGVYVISAEPSKVDTPVVENKPKAKIFRKIKMLHAGADEVYGRVVMNRVLDPMAKHKELLHAVELVKQSGMASSMRNSGSNAFQSGNVYDAYMNANRFAPRSAASNAVDPTIDGGNSIQVPGEQSKQVGGGGLGLGGGGGIGGGQGGLGGGAGLGGGQGGLGGGAGGGATLQGGQGLVPDTIDHISFDPTDNSLIVQGTSEEDINQLQNIIAQFDVQPKQVQIRVEFITTTENLDQSLGFGIQYSRGTIIAGIDNRDFIRASDPVFVTYATGDAVFRLRTRLSEGYGRVVTAPLLRTLNNTPATVSAFTFDFILVAQTQVTQGILQTFVTPQQLPIGTSLSITPRINGDGTITMGLAPFVGGTTGVRSVSISNTTTLDLPITTSQSVLSVVTIKNKDTIVIGGLNTESVNTTVNRVPILSDLPIIGQFFRRTAKGKSSSELLIFVTPEIIEDEDGAISPF